MKMGLLMHATEKARILGPADGEAGRLGGMGVRFMIDAAQTSGHFSLVEHPMGPRALCAPLHRHTREDEYSYVLEGRVGALLGDEVVYGEPGDLIFKPRGQWHTRSSRPADSRVTSSGSWRCSPRMGPPTRRRSRRWRPITGSRSTWRASRD
jgi:quercetin dioxygenase-like cupin family protein